MLNVFCYFYRFFHKLKFKLFSINLCHQLSVSPSDVTLFGKVIIENPRNVTIKSGVTMNAGVYISGHDKVFIGENVSLSVGCKIITAYLDSSKLTSKSDLDIHLSKPVYIGRNSQIGAGAIVLPGVKIGCGVIVAAGSVVTKDIEDGVIVAGVPAKVIRDIKCH